MENRPGRSRGENDFHNFGNVEVKKISIIVFFFWSWTVAFEWKRPVVGRAHLSEGEQLFAFFVF